MLSSTSQTHPKSFKFQFFSIVESHIAINGLTKKLKQYFDSWLQFHKSVLDNVFPPTPNKKRLKETIPKCNPSPLQHCVYNVTWTFTFMANLSMINDYIDYYSWIIKKLDHDDPLST